MAVYECSVCGYIYDESKEEVPWLDLPESWVCPLCETEKRFFKIKETEAELPQQPSQDKPDLGTYLAEWSRPSDELEIYMEHIHKIAETGESVIEPMRSRKVAIAWNDILIKGAQLFKLPLNEDEPVKSKTVIGPKAAKPLVIESPVIISHMSFGALSKETKIALAKGSATAKTAICSGEGGILDDELEAAHKYIFEYVPNKYSVTESYLQQVDAVEIKIGQSAKPGMGGHLPGCKVTEEIAAVRGKTVGKDIISPSRFPDIKNQDDLKERIEDLRSMTGGKPIGIKLAAGHIEKDLEIALFAQPDFITIDGRTGATGAAQKFVKDSTSVPTIHALHRARKYLDENGASEVSLIITGGLRISADFAKALAMGADAVAIASSALLACGCQQYRICNTGKCPVGITTQDPELRKHLKIDISSKRLANFLKVSTEEIKTFARLTGNGNVHDLAIDDLMTTNSDISEFTYIEHV
ncbi:MAG: glutamate synthase-related protein [Victivallaceae bacterium]|nr:glutamate synthase-related protein [Victivallaceae bacterium]